ncbi:hypothetical protein [uncultured Capnocytophaga sp.]|uniref:hypothetical protein n=1 Tax=uncultured Capnocytophaga sp. TaxID=159273 RepID=UPI00260EA5B3|nr:hypothetical protein [uncultured Capnocytophaga sp.]
MIKKILLFAVATIGLVACSKDDNKTNQEVEKTTITEENFIGKWSGTIEYIARDTAKQAKLNELIAKEQECKTSTVVEFRKSATKYVSQLLGRVCDNAPLEEATYLVSGETILYRNDNAMSILNYKFNTKNNVYFETLPDAEIGILDEEGHNAEMAKLDIDDPNYLKKVEELNKKYIILYNVRWNLNRQ